jgi:TPR repeat protein
VARAEKMYEKACNGGSSAGCLNLGLAFAARDDQVHAAALYERSCSGGWAAGCHQLAVSYQQGEGVAKDVGRALALFNQACDGDFLDGCTTAAEIYATGQLVPRDIAAAAALYGKAIKALDLGCQAGADHDCNERERLKNRLTLLAALPAARQ